MWGRRGEDASAPAAVRGARKGTRRKVVKMGTRAGVHSRGPLAMACRAAGADARRSKVQRAPPTRVLRPHPRDRRLHASHRGRLAAAGAAAELARSRLRRCELGLQIGHTALLPLPRGCAGARHIGAEEECGPGMRACSGGAEPPHARWGPRGRVRAPLATAQRARPSAAGWRRTASSFGRRCRFQTHPVFWWRTRVRSGAATTSPRHLRSHGPHLPPVAAGTLLQSCVDACLRS